MSPSLLYRLFRVGAIPAALRAELEGEGLVAADEGIRGWTILRDFAAPGKRFKFRMKSFTGFLAVTEKRVVAWTGKSKIVDVPFDREEFRALEIETPDPDRLLISFESSLFHPDWRGRIVLRFETPKALELRDALISRV